MAKLEWDTDGTRLFEAGVKNGILALINKGTYDTPVPWNGLTSVTDSPDGAEEQPLYADGIKYGAMRSAETFGGTIECYTYPVEFRVCNGFAAVTKGAYIGQQTRNPFGFGYINNVGNDVDGIDYGERLHLIYNCTASPSEEQNQTINDSPEAKNPSFEYTSNPVAVTGFKPTSEFIVDSREVGEAVWKKVTDLVFGTESGEPKFPLPDELIALMKTNQAG